MYNIPTLKHVKTRIRISYKLLLIKSRFGIIVDDSRKITTAYGIRINVNYITVKCILFG